MSRPLRVVHIIATLTTGGAERQLELLVRHSSADSTVVALYAGGPVADSMQAAGQRVEVLGMAGWRRPLAALRLARRLRALRPDVVHVHLLAAQLWGIPAARLAGVPVIVSSEHSLMDDTIEGRPHTAWLRLVYRLLERLATHTVAVSATTAERLARWGVPASRVSVVDNGLDLPALAFDPAARAAVREELGLSAAVAVGVVGRLDPVKRVDEVLVALALLLHAGTHVLVVAGAGPLREALERQADELGVRAQVRFVGARGDVPRLLSALDALVSASRDETFGLAVVEGLASGLPVVYARCPALDELDRLPPGAVPAGADALAAALPTTVRADADRACPAALDRYDVRASAAAVDALHRRLTGLPPASAETLRDIHGPHRERQQACP